jgi:hypothetical protein
MFVVVVVVVILLIRKIIFADSFTEKILKLLKQISHRKFFEVFLYYPEKTVGFFPGILSKVSQPPRQYLLMVLPSTQTILYFLSQGWTP